MNKIIIYGLGKKYEELLNEKNLCDYITVQLGIDVIGLSDSDMNKWGSFMPFAGIYREVKSIKKYADDEYEGIIITSNIHFDEIRSSLIDEGIRAEKIYSIDSLLNSYIENTYRIENFVDKKGIEIGGPTKLFQCIYDVCSSCDDVNYSNETVWWCSEGEGYQNNGKYLGDIYIADATDMHVIEDSKYDFVLSSNNLEHIANPIKALKECARICKEDGIILILVPRKEKTFDHNRDFTSWEHILEDYYKDTNEDDLSHLPEIIEKHDYDMNRSCGGKEKFIERAKKNYENRCLHHHVFSKESLYKMFEFVRFEVIFVNVLFSNYIIIGKRKV